MNLGGRGPGTLERQIVRLLLVRERHGYEIAKLVRFEARRSAAADEERSSTEPLPFDGAVYPILRRLEHEGLIRGHWVEVGEGRPRRRYYVLTPEGLRDAARQQPGRTAAAMPKGARA